MHGNFLLATLFIITGTFSVVGVLQQWKILIQIRNLRKLYLVLGMVSIVLGTMLLVKI